MIQVSWSRKVFLICNYIFLLTLSFLCLFPLIHVLAISFSTSGAATAGLVKLWPVNSPTHYPLQSYLRTVVIQKDMSMFNTNDLQMLAEISDRTFKAAQIFLGALPILLVYPFLQRFFVKGIVLGRVKE